MRNNASEAVLMTGTVDTVKFWTAILANSLEASLRGNGTPADVSVQTLTYEIPIAGNPHARRFAEVRVTLDERDNSGSIKVSKGAELLRWQSETKTICDCCAFGNTWYSRRICSELMGPSDSKKWCRKYRFKGAAAATPHPSSAYPLVASAAEHS